MLPERSLPVLPNVGTSVIQTIITKDLTEGINTLKAEINNAPDLNHWGAWDDDRFEISGFKTDYVRRHDINFTNTEFAITGNSINASLAGSYSLALGFRRGRAFLVPPGIVQLGSCENRRFRASIKVPIAIDSSYNIQHNTSVSLIVEDGCDATFLNNQVARRLLPGWGALITFVINTIIKERGETQIRDTVNRHIESKVAEIKLSQNVNDLWESLLAPSKIESPEAENSWLLLQPEAILLSPIRGAGQTVSISLGVLARPTIVIGNPPPASTKPLPAPQEAASSPSFHIVSNGLLYFDEASQLLEDEIVNTDLAVGAGKIRLLGATVSGSGEDVVIKIRFDGAFAGAMHLIGKVKLDTRANTLSTYDLHFSSETRDTIGRALEDSLNHADFLRFLEGKARWDLAKSTQKAKEAILKGINRSLGEKKNVVISGTINDLRMLSFAAVKDIGFYFVTSADGSVQINIR